MHKLMLLLTALSVLALAACGGDGPSPTPTPPTATFTVSPVQGIQTVCLEVVAEGTPCEATLTIAFTGEPLGAFYEGAPAPGVCYNGAEINGQMSLTVPGGAPLTLPISGDVPAPPTVFGCADKTDAPFDRAWPTPVLSRLAEVWGIQALLNAVGDEDEYVREAAADALGEMGPEAKDAVPALIQTLGDGDEHVRRAAADALGEMGPEAKEAVPALLQALEDAEWSVREAAAVALGKIGPEAKEAVAALIQALADEDLSVRWRAANALRDIGPEAKDAVPALVQALADESEVMRGYAAEALEAITGQDFGEDADRWQQW